MKRKLVKGFTVLALLFTFANCGSKSNNGNPNTYYPYNPSYSNPYQYNMAYQNMYGPGNYCGWYQYNCIQCQYPVCVTSGCGYQTAYYALPGYYAPQYGIYGQGGYFNMSVGW